MRSGFLRRGKGEIFMERGTIDLACCFADWHWGAVMGIQPEGVKSQRECEKMLWGLGFGGILRWACLLAS